VIQDITERKRREQALRASEERFSKAFHNSPTPMVVIKIRDSSFVDANESFLRVLGYARHEVVGRFARELGDWFVELLDKASRRLAAGKPFRDEELSGHARSSEPRTFLTSFDSIELGADSCLLASFVDLTERNRVEELLRQSQKMEAIGSLAGGVAHDFNNLLTAINGYSELVLMSLDESDRHYDLVRSIRDSGERAAVLTRKLLAFSRKEVAKPTTLTLNALVSEMEALLRRLIEENVELVTELAPDTPKINADRGQIEQILMNLVVNARDAMPFGGKIVIETGNATVVTPSPDTLLEAPPGRYAVLSVSDTGVGMTPEIRAKIFEPFFTTKPVGKGTGLGLAMVYGIVEQQGGAIAVSSEPGRGATFRVYFPEIGRPSVVAASPGAERDATPRGTETVLVVEDEDSVRKFVHYALSSQGYRVLEASNGHEALKILAHAGEEIDLVLTDVVMPDMGGDELAGHLHVLRESLPVLFTSGYSKNLAEGRGPQSAEYFIGKPFSPAELVKKIRDVLDRSRRGG
jgi:two-component system, cell cycle sensor histidine kinase and response regulator CckA